MFCIRRVSPAIVVFAVTFATCLGQTPATAAAANDAYVYIGTTKGVYLYDAAANGSLTPVSGSPFSIAGSAVGSNGKYFLSLGTNYIHSYSVASNGAIKGQVSQINAQTYFSEPNSDCGTNANAVLDHTGQEIYVQLGLNGCSALQSYQLSSAGKLSFIDSTSFDSGYTDPYVPAPAITANDLYGYNGVFIGSCAELTNVFQRQSSGALISDAGTTMNFPAPDPGWGGYGPLPTLTTDPSNHLAIVLQEYSPEGCGGPVKPAQLASYTVDSQGDLNTTNTATNMPTPDVFPTVMNMSPSGQFLAVGGNPNPNIYGSTAPQTAGLKVFRFNGANPITTDSGTLTADPIDEIHWDNSNHLYALSYSTGKLYVYTVTSGGITAAPGSPYSLPTPNALVVVPTASGNSSCSAPASPGVNICAPVSDSTVGSPAEVEATATVTGTIASTQLWVDGVKKYATASKFLDTSVSLAAGTHRFAIVATNTAGQKWESAVNATIAGTGACTAPSTPGVNICLPTNGSTIHSPVQVQAADLVTGTLASTQLWVDGVKKYSVASNSFNTSVSLAAGSHRFAVLATNTAGQKWENAVDTTVAASGVCIPPSPDSETVNICQPANGSTVSSPVQVQALASANQDLAFMELWVDGVKKYHAATSSLNISVALAPGTHRFAVLAYYQGRNQPESAVYATVK